MSYPPHVVEVPGVKLVRSTLTFAEFPTGVEPSGATMVKVALPMESARLLLIAGRAPGRAARIAAARIDPRTAYFRMAPR